MANSNGLRLVHLHCGRIDYLHRSGKQLGLVRCD